MVRTLSGNLSVIKVELAGSPLRNLNCYVYQTPERNLLIDTGFRTPECLADLQRGIAELCLDMSKTDVLATHLHADHSGLIDKILAPGCKVYMGEVDKALWEDNMRGDEQYWGGIMRQYAQEGFPLPLAVTAVEHNPARVFASKAAIELTPLRDGQILEVGDIRLECIHTPGHTPGHICLYNPADKSMILGDHVLFDITPNITSWPTLRNSLKSYLESLHKIRAYSVSLPLPGHRECHLSMDQRIEQLMAHHDRRLKETLSIVNEHPEISAYDVAGYMTWSVRAKNWDEFPLVQKWFAMGETLAHLYYLEEQGAIRREILNDRALYTVTSQ